jgi:hypothetical protein
MLISVRVYRRIAAVFAAGILFYMGVIENLIIHSRFLMEETKFNKNIFFALVSN